MANLGDIENLTRQYADARGVLSSRVRSLEAKLAAEKEQRLPAIKSALSKAKEAEARLKAALKESPELFARPKTQVFHGVKVGFQKGKGKLSWEDDEAVVRLIEKHFPDSADVLTRTTTAPNKQTLAELLPEDLKKLGVTVEETGETVVIKPVNSDIERIVSALLKDKDENYERGVA